MLDVGRRFGVYGTAAIVKFCNPLPPIICAKPPWGTLELKNTQVRYDKEATSFFKKNLHKECAHNLEITFSEEIFVINRYQFPTF